ncbi:hypothetical protein [Evansella tamaricis]|uniref:Uncharacterized protein n=1 Tax=Evansella tamaricis TaxID=2069301 RepID=A0ABS6JB34_9BACI|nr:hypothetical protein [Evansella tamaricis]MBU9710894.1 hypothetical protein [Evansella tamaricis]
MDRYTKQGKQGFDSKKGLDDMFNSIFDSYDHNEYRVIEGYIVEDSSNCSEIDRKIFLSLLNCRDVYFYTERKLNMSLYTLMEEVYGENNKSNEKIIKVKLANMGLTSLSSSTNDRYVSRAIFDAISVDKDLDGNWEVNARLTGYLHNKIIKLQLANKYHNQLEIIKQGYAKELFYYIQEQRIKNTINVSSSMTVMNGIDEPYVSEFKLKDRGSILKKYEIALKEFEQWGIVKSYEKNEDGFIIKYSNLRKDDLMKLVNATITIEESLWDIVIGDI